MKSIVCDGGVLLCGCGISHYSSAFLCVVEPNENKTEKKRNVLKWLLFILQHKQCESQMENHKTTESSRKNFFTFAAFFPSILEILNINSDIKE